MRVPILNFPESKYLYQPIGISLIISAIYILTPLVNFGQESINYFPEDHYFFQFTEVKSRTGNIKHHANVWPLTFNKNADDSCTSHQKLSIKETSKSALSFVPNGVFYTGYDLSQGTKENLSFWTYLLPSVNFQLNNKLTINLGTLASTGNFWHQLSNTIENTGIIPGNTFAKKYGIAHTSIIPTGYISYAPNKIFNFQIGQDKHFIGNGYRSVLLSHNASPFPYFRIITKLKRFQYTNLLSSFNHFSKTEDKITATKRKFSAMHILSWNIHKNFNLYFFEAIVWPNKDSLNHRGFDFNYLNPLVFYRPVEYSIGSSDNALMGLGWQFITSKKFRLYGQFILDEFLLSEIRADVKHFFNQKDTSIKAGWWANKYGVQLGFKVTDSVKNGLLKIIGELNLARPFTYTHGSVTQSYTHANQPLAHPLGTNYVETLIITKYSIGKWDFRAKGIYAMFGKDGKNENLGGDIFKSYKNPSKIYKNALGQGIRNDLWQLEIEIAYPFFNNPQTKLFAGYYLRHQQSSLQTTITNYPFIGLRMGSILRYTDF